VKNISEILSFDIFDKFKQHKKGCFCYYVRSQMKKMLHKL